MKKSISMRGLATASLLLSTFLTSNLVVAEQLSGLCEGEDAKALNISPK